MLREITFDSKKVPAFLDGAINTMTLAKKTGIINLFSKCTVTAPIDYTVTGYGTITFNDGAIVVCGRVIYIEAGTTLAVPITTTAGGSIGVKVDLNQNAGSHVTFYSKTTQTLTQQDLNTNKTDGVYEFEIFKYTSNGTTLTLTYQTASIFETNETTLTRIFDGTLKVGSAENADNATNAEKSILNNDTTYSALTNDANNILKVDDEYIIPKIKLLSDTEIAISTSSFSSIYTDTSSLRGRKFKIYIESDLGGKICSIFFPTNAVSAIPFAITMWNVNNLSTYPLLVKLSSDFKSIQALKENQGYPIRKTKIYEIFE